jgi:hypothetical protein
MRISTQQPADTRQLASENPAKLQDLLIPLSHVLDVFITSGMPCSPSLVLVLALCAFCITLCTGPAAHSQQTAEPPQLQNMSAVIHTHAVMCLAPGPALQPVSVHVLALCAFRITLCMQK